MKTLHTKSTVKNGKLIIDMPESYEGLSVDVDIHTGSRKRYKTKEEFMEALQMNTINLDLSNWKFNRDEIHER